jgi:4-aminobutyrate aminotransferase-like enzyme
VVARALAKGLIIKTCGPALEFAPPLIIQAGEIEEAVSILDQCISDEEKDMQL